MPNNDSDQKDPHSGLRRAVTITFFVCIVSCCVLVTIQVFRASMQELIWRPIAIKHFATVIGLPMAAVASLFVVLVLEKTTGKIEFEALGFKFRGASGPVVLWLLCFLGIAAAIRMLWDCSYSPQ